jgi:hypothetical protein
MKDLKFVSPSLAQRQQRAGFGYLRGDYVDFRRRLKSFAMK